MYSKDDEVQVASVLEKVLGHVEQVLSSKGETPTLLRQAALGNTLELPEELQALVGKIHNTPGRIVEEDVTSLRQKYSDDELFEIIVAAALGASSARMDVALTAMEEVLAQEDIWV